MNNECTLRKERNILADLFAYSLEAEQVFSFFLMQIILLLNLEPKNEFSTANYVTLTKPLTLVEISKRQSIWFKWQRI